jgi:hypothetical protein
VDGRADSRRGRHFGSALSCHFLPRRDRPSARRAEAGIRDETVIKNKPLRKGEGVESKAGSIGERDAGSVHCPGWCCVRELPYGIGNPAPGHCAVVIAVGRKLVDTRGALLKRLLAIAFEHQVGGSPNIDLRYHATKGARLRSKPFNFVLPASTYQSALLSSPTLSERFLPRGPQHGFNVTCDER